MRKSIAKWNDCDVVVRKCCDVITSAQKFAAGGFQEQGLRDDSEYSFAVRQLIPYLFRSIGLPKLDSAEEYVKRPQA